MDFNKDLEQYVYEYDGLIFFGDEEPEEDIQDTVKMLAGNYFEHLDTIIDIRIDEVDSYLTYIEG